MYIVVYKIPYRRAPLGRVRRASKGILHTMYIAAPKRLKGKISLYSSLKISATSCLKKEFYLIKVRLVFPTIFIVYSEGSIGIPARVFC